MKRSQIEQQDFVDNEIFELLNKLSPVKLDWDIESIGKIRDSIQEVLVEDKQVISETDFYA